MEAEQFRRRARDDGYGAAEALEIGPDVTREMHTHDVTCFLLLLEGELTLATERGKEVFKPGETCVVTAGTLHAECTGPGGARGLIARK